MYITELQNLGNEVSDSNNDADIITEKLLCCTTLCSEALTHLRIILRREVLCSMFYCYWLY